MKFKDLIKKTRIDLALTQKEFGKRINLSGSTIANWENEKLHPVKDSIINIISETFKISRKEIIDSIAESMDSSYEDEYIKDYINYPFLTDDILNLKISKEELDLFKLIQLNKYILDTETKININFSNLFELEDSIKIKKILKSLKDKLLKIKIDLLEKFVYEHNFDDFYIQDLSKNEIIELLEDKYNLKEILLLLNKIKDNKFYLYEDYIYLINNNEIPLKNIYCNDTNDCFYDLLTDKIISVKNIRSLTSNEIKNIDFEKYCIKDIDEFISIYSKESDLFLEKKKQYELDLKQYEIDYKEWENKMNRIIELQNLYNDKEKYPDILAPKKPKLIEEKIKYITLSEKGKYFLDFLEEIFKEKTEILFSNNFRQNLEPYFDKNIILNVFLQEEKIKNNNKYYLFKDIRKDFVKIEDHLWIKDNDYNLEIGKNYKIEGTVIIYEKHNQYGIKEKDYTINVLNIESI